MTQSCLARLYEFNGGGMRSRVRYATRPPRSGLVKWVSPTAHRALWALGVGFGATRNVQDLVDRPPALEVQFLA
jgi:hypothetical protein